MTSLEHVINFCTRRLTRGARDLVIQYLTDAAAGDDDRLMAAWSVSNGQIGPWPESVRAFTELCIQTLSDPAIPSDGTMIGPGGRPHED